MDAPPDKEDSRPYVRVAGFLESMQLNAPRVLEADLDKGFLLLSDLGKREYLRVLDDDIASVFWLYDDALSALQVLQARGTAFQGLLPAYDEERFRVEMSLFRDWLCGKHLGFEFDDRMASCWTECCDLLVANALDQPQVFVHRDYHSRNLMVCDEDNPGILDFQDAMEGPLTYDLVSLLKDCYVKWPAEQVRDWALQFYQGLDDSVRRRMPEPAFLRAFDLMGVQRHLKAAGIFARLNHRDGKPGFLDDVPRTLSYIVELGPRYPELEFIVTLIEDRVLPAMESAS
jgi:aminoglycoside/choline kinase family phosphotransferase